MKKISIKLAKIKYTMKILLFFYIIAKNL